MGKKQFITKKSATKYDLIFRSGEESAPQRDWVESSRKVGIGRPDAQQLAQNVHSEQKRRYPEGHPLSWLRSRAEEDVITDERRREIIALGFPDDGYDYLKHLRRGQSLATPGAEGEANEGQSAVQESYSGPSVYVSAPDFEAPPQDYKAIDASRLTVHQAATNDDNAALIAGGASAFARELNTVRKRQQQEIEEMEKLMRQFEDLDDDEKGDLLEDFVLTATEVGEEGGPTKPRPSLPLFEARVQAASSDGSDWEEGSEDSSTEAYHPKAPRSETKSFASTYWRAERNDRNANLSVIDERFEQLALEYDSDDIGELDELHEEPSARGVATTDQFSKVMDDFLTSHATQDHAHEGGQAYLPPSAACANGVTGEEATVAAEALAKTKEHLWRMEEQGAGDVGARDEDDDLSQHDEEPRERWDCESVLTTRSTLYNHPAKLDAGGKSVRRDHIKLSSKTGLPVLRSTGGEAPAAPDRQAESSTRQLPLQRQPEETLAEKGARKSAIKTAKRQARASKKELKTLYKEGARKQKQMAAPAISTVRIP